MHEIRHRLVIYLQAAVGKPIGEALQSHVATRFDLLQHPFPVRAPDLERNKEGLKPGLAATACRLSPASTKPTARSRNNIG